MPSGTIAGAMTPGAHDPSVLALTVAAPWGPVQVAATARGIVAVEMMTTRDAFESGLERRLGRRPRWLDVGAARDAGDARDKGGEGGEGAASDSGDAGDAGDPGDAGETLPAVRHLRAAAHAIGAQASGDRGALDWGALARLPLDLEDRPAWDLAVLDAVRAIPRGETRSYAEIARAIGRPGAARAVGGAIGRNPISLFIPCHRVIAADGTLGGYGGDAWGSRDELLALKRDLLLREGTTVRNRGG